MPNTQEQEPGFVSPEAQAEQLQQNIERARELLGQENVFGIEDVEKTFGVSLDAKDVPPISFSQQELEQARENGEQLILRIDKLPNGQPATINNLMAHLEKQGKKVFAGDAEEIKKDVAGNDMEFFTREPLQAKWVLASAKEIGGTRHLSYEAQDAFMKKDVDKLRAGLESIPKVWDEIGIPAEAKPELPTLEELQQSRDQLPQGASLPSAAEVVYDLLLRQARGEYALKDMAVATRSRVQELPDIDEPERPIDIGLNDEDGVHFHWRRSIQFGRPGETKPDAIPGIPIGYIQREAGGSEKPWTDREKDAQIQAQQEAEVAQRKADDEAKIAEIKKSLEV